MKMIYPGRVVNSNRNKLYGQISIFKIIDIGHIKSAIVNVSISVPGAYAWKEKSIRWTYEYSIMDDVITLNGKMCCNGAVPFQGEHIFNIEIDRFVNTVVQSMIYNILYNESTQREVKFIVDEEKKMIYAERDI